ncbi:MAG: hypothetical protein JST04_10370 [Bdellovibrionales bacterium]|nr:hypothetical protein [Bdellovibrionales bacterium]
MIASVLIIALVAAGAAGIRQMNILSQVASTRTAHTEIRTRVLGALNDSGVCAANLGNLTITNRFSPTTVPVIRDGGSILLEDGKAAPKEFGFSGLKFHLSLIFPTPGSADPFHSGLGRTTPQDRYSARLEIRAERDNLKQQTKSEIADLVGQIPLSVEIDAADRLVSCTVHAGDMDELLFGGTHTVRECMLNGGFPILADVGLICRIPVPYITQKTNNYPNYTDSFVLAGNRIGIPKCDTLATLGGGGAWSNVTDASGMPYNSTLPYSQNNLPVCKGDNFVNTGWHSMGPFAVESTPMDKYKKNAANTVSTLLGGAALAATVGDAIFPGLGLAIASTLATIAFIVSLFHKCKTKTVTFYAQVNAVGCR